MITISVRVCGDRWINRAQVMQLIAEASPKETLILDLHSEGPSLKTIGLIDYLDAHCRENARDPTTIYISRWSNSVETVPYKRTGNFSLSHFFSLSGRYSDSYIPDHIDNDALLFGLFVGRITPERMHMLYYMFSTHRQRCLLSLMHNRVIADYKDEWPMDPGFQEFWDSPPLSSIDNHWVHDQYDGSSDCNRDLLAHYNRFHIEIVAETYTRGVCFFPTEKTVRPIITGKPMLIFGPRHFLSNLRNLGFRTWQHLWPEDYDDLEGYDRWMSMRSAIELLSNLSQSQKIDLLYQCQDITRHNRELVSTLINKVPR